MKIEKHIGTAKFLSILVILSSIIGCKKFVDIPQPLTKVTSANVFSTDATATSAAVGLYYQMTATNLSIFSGGQTLYPGLSADEISNVSPSTAYDPFKNNILLSNISTVGTIWQNAYSYIYQANDVLEGVKASKTLSSAVRQQLQGEMLFIRALNYFYLVNLFGDVPLELSSDYVTNQSLPRTPSAKIYDQLKADLTLSESLLSQSFATSSNLRPNQMAAAALLARVCLYQGDWATAETYATKTINSNAYHLETNLNNVFLNSSAETLFQLSKLSGNTVDGLDFIPSSATVKPAFTITQALLNAFQTGDNRKSAWLKSNTINGTVYYYPFKYKVRSNSPVTEFEIVLRLAEQYLIRAEARAHQNNIDGAQTDINVIRNRAGLANTTAVTVNDLLTTIMNERQVELFAEFGQRWLDLNRTGTANAVLGPQKGTNWQPTDALYPIPLSQTLANPFLIQNPSY